MSYKLTFLENWVFQAFWRIFPQSVKNGLSRVILFFQRRAAFVIPQTTVEVYAFSASMRNVFPQAIFLDAEGQQLSLLESNKDSFPCTLITSCLNEANTIVPWLDSLLSQSILPTEVIIADGGSSDTTVALIEEWIKTHPQVAVNVFVAPGSNIAQGRNLAIQRATHQILLMTDVGCTLTPRWVEQLWFPFVHQPQTQVVMGWYEPIIKSEFLKHIAHFIVPKLNQIQPITFLPSGRSLAMKKSLWQESNGFPEYLSLAGEDSLFDIQWKMRAKDVAFCPDAVVLWKFPATTWQAVRTIARYAQGDAESGTLFWAHYVWLARTFFVVVVSGLIGLIGLRGTESSWLWWLSLVCVGYSMNRLWGMILAFSPLNTARSFQEKLYRVGAVCCVIVGQVVGFVVGLMKFSGVQEKKRAQEGIVPSPVLPAKAGMTY